MTSRIEQKLKTRRIIIDSAFSQLSAEQSFSNLGLREVTRTAGLAPTSFYRHFDDMNDLGLALVEESGLTLRQMMRKARSRIEHPNTAIEVSVETLAEFLDNYTTHFRLLLQEQSGNSQAFRHAVSKEIEYFISELEDYLEQRAREMDRPTLDASNIAEAMVAIVINMAIKLMDAPKNQRATIQTRAKLQLRLVMVGGLKSVSTRKP
jgi:AcrR family transcriptional regulator